jgi:hypothetical protein
MLETKAKHMANGPQRWEIGEFFTITMARDYWVYIKERQLASLSFNCCTTFSRIILLSF